MKYDDILRKSVCIILLAVFLTAPSCGPLSSNIIIDPGAAGDRMKQGSSIQAEVDRLASPLIEKRKNVGIAVGILTPDAGTYVFGFGRTEKGGEKKPTGDTLFGVGSITKGFVASLLAILVDEGKVSYDDTVVSIIPDTVDLSDAAKNITLLELVTHTSGLKREPRNSKCLFSFIRYMLTGKNLYGFLEKDELYKYLRTFRKETDRDDPFIYSNVGAGLLGYLLEIKTSRSLPDLMAEKVSGPLKLRDTVYFLSEEQKTRLASGHVGDQPFFRPRGAKIENWRVNDVMLGSGGMFSTVNDLLIFAKASMGMTGLLIEPFLTSTHDVKIKRESRSVASGWFIDSFYNGRQKIIFQHGMISGYSSYIGLDTRAKIAVIVLCNNFNWDDSIGHNLILTLTRGLNCYPEIERLVEAGEIEEIRGVEM